MSPRKNKVTKGKRTKRTKVTRRPASDAGEFSGASTQDTQPASTLGKRKRPVIPDSDDEWVTDDETEDGSAVLSNPTTDSDLDDNVTVQPPGLSPLYSSDEVTASEDHDSDLEGAIKTLKEFYRELPHRLDRDRSPAWGHIGGVCNRVPFMDY